MPKGNKEITDKELLEFLNKQIRPLAKSVIETKLRWSHGKTIGAIRRLEDQRIKLQKDPRVVSVWAKKGRGHDQRFVGLLAKKDYWKKFREELTLDNFNVTYDPHSIFSQSTQISIQSEPINESIKPFLHIIEEYLDDINEAANVRKTDITTVLRNIIEQGVKPEFPLFLTLVDKFLDKMELLKDPSLLVEILDEAQEAT